MLVYPASEVLCGGMCRGYCTVYRHRRWLDVAEAHVLLSAAATSPSDYVIQAEQVGARCGLNLTRITYFIMRPLGCGRCSESIS